MDLLIIVNLRGAVTPGAPQMDSNMADDICNSWQSGTNAMVNSLMLINCQASFSNQPPDRGCNGIQAAIDNCDTSLIASSRSYIKSQNTHVMQLLIAYPEEQGMEPRARR